MIDLSFNILKICYRESKDPEGISPSVRNWTKVTVAEEGAVAFGQ